jgi:hypothetical protein
MPTETAEELKEAQSALMKIREQEIGQLEQRFSGLEVLTGTPERTTKG